MIAENRLRVEQLCRDLLKEADVLKKWLKEPDGENYCAGLIEGMQDLVEQARAIDRAEYAEAEAETA